MKPHWWCPTNPVIIAAQERCDEACLPAYERYLAELERVSMEVAYKHYLEAIAP